MTPHNPAHTWTWTGDRTLPTWLDRRHHWHHDRPVIHTTDGPRHLHDGWMVILWTDGAITVASATVADRVYGDNGIAGRLAAAEQRVQRITELRDRWVTAGPPPLGTSINRWWDKRLVELSATLQPAATEEQTDA